MKALRAAAGEVWGFFVGDVSHTIAMLVWVAIVGALAQTHANAVWLGPVLLLGLAAILIENVNRAARRSRK